MGQHCDGGSEHIDNAVHVLLVLLDFAGAPPPSSTANATADHPSSARGLEQKSNCEDSVPADEAAAPMKLAAQWPKNAFARLLQSVSEDADFEVMFQGFSRLLNNFHEAESTYLPSSMKQIRYHQSFLYCYGNALI